MIDRTTYIGGSDIAAIMGISPWRTVWDVYLQKTADPLAEVIEETDAMRWGTLLEGVLLDEVERQKGYQLERQVGVIHLEHAFLRGHLDGWEITPGYGGIVEAKTSHSTRDWGPKEAPTVPEYHQAQVYFYLAITGAPWCDVAVLLPRGDFRIIRLDADEEIQRGIVAAAVAFWQNHVIPRIPPKVDASPAATRWLAAMPDDEADTLEAGADLEDIVERLSGVRKAKKALESTETLLENEAKAAIGEHQRAVGRGWHITFKRNRPFRQTTWKDAAGEMATMLQLAGHPEMAEDAIRNHTTIVENRRPFVLKREDEE